MEHFANPAFMVLVLIKWMRSRSKLKFPFATPEVWEIYLRTIMREVAQLSACEVFVDGWSNGCSFCSIGGLMLRWVMRVGFENTCTVSRKWNEDAGSVQYFIFWFCVCCRPRKSWGRMSPMFPYVTTVIKRFPSDLLRAIISCWTKAHPESCQTSLLDHFCKNSPQPNALSNVPPFRKAL